jgi:transcription elongation factor Elf1
MRVDEALSQVERKLESNLKKRFACPRCGKTWVEIVGLFSGHADGKEEVFFQLGHESEACSNCQFRVKTCPTCGSKDAYEINFPPNSQDSALSFEQIRIVNKA